MLYTLHRNVITLLAIIILPLAMLPARATSHPHSTTSTVKTYRSDCAEGLIGISDESPVDNPFDNIFHVVLQEKLQGQEKVFLVYDLEGVEDHTSVSRSINNQLAVGGYLVKKRRGWATQREQISTAWLKEGDNIIRFTVPEGATHGYRVRNVSIQVESATGTGDEQIIVNAVTRYYYQHKAYIKGFIPPTRSDIARLRIGGKDIRLWNGEFEAIVEKPVDEHDQWQAEIELVLANGETRCQAVIFANATSADYEFPLVHGIGHTQKKINALQASTIALESARLSLPAGAVKEVTSISITTLRDIDIPALDPGMINVTQCSNGYRFLPHGTLFDKEVNVVLGYDEEKIPDGYTVNDIRTYYFDEETHHWVALPLDTVLAESGELRSRTTHFTDMINAIIKVPESPEVQAYNSTSMKGIKAANPTAAINLINPPQANNTGSASVGYPIIVPAGRAGMQPQLSISYNSSGGNGWLGLGWNLSLPMITIDTRWGVPRYDAEKETETYTLNGEQLSPVAHRGELVNRTAEKQFHPRVEGAFNKIVRHGNHPSNYWWEVTDKNGTRYFYGGSGSGTGSFDKNAVLRTNEESDGGNVAYWCLSEVRDLNGNFVKYHYVKQQDPGVQGGTVKGYQIYIQKITYTGHQGAEGKYSVHFIRDREIPQGYTRRQDVSIAGNLGFKQVTADLLKKIEVKFDNKNIRSYELKYKPGAFFKTLLESITEFDRKGNVFNAHTFDYYDDVNVKAGYTPFLPATSWNTGDDGRIRGKFINPIEHFNDDASALSGTQSKDRSIGLAVTVGFNAQIFNKTLSVGGSFNSSTSESESLLNLVDLNGDGLPDKVFTKDDKLWYRPNLSRAGGEERFGDRVEIKFKNSSIRTFYKEKSKTKSGGLEAHGPSSAPVFGGYSRSKTNSETSVYFTEVNGDQLPDLVQNGIVYFTRINPDTGHPEFVESSAQTPSAIFQNGTISNELFPGEDQSELEKAIAENPLHDVVRMWEAPYSGRIRIIAPVQLIRSDDEERAETPADGVRVAIQLKDSERWSTIIAADDYSIQTPFGVDDLLVAKGDRVYFRVGSVFNGSYDQVSWSPVIEYRNLPVVLTTDANNKSYKRYDSKQDFKLSAIQKVSVPIKGRIAVQSIFRKPVTSDDVQLEIIHEVTNPDDPNDPEKIIRTDTLWIKNYTWKNSIDKDTLFQWDVEKGHNFRFKVHANSNVDWTAVSWIPRVYYTASFDPSYKDVTDEKGNPLIEFYPVPEYTLYAEELKISNPNKIWGASDSVSFAVRPRLDIEPPSITNPFGYSGDIYFTVKKQNMLLLKDTIKVQNNIIVSELKQRTLKVLKNDRVFFEYHVSRPSNLPASQPGLAYAIRESKVNLTVNDTLKVLEAGLHTGTNQKMIFGPMYRNWGQFAYQANGARATQPIIQSELKVDEEDLKKRAPKTNPNDLNDGRDLNDQNTYQPSKEKFIMLVPVAKEQIFIGYDNHTWVSATTISSSRMGDDDLNSATTPPGSSARAINKKTESTSNSYSLGASAGFFGASKTWSDGTSKVVSDYMDFNGDRYPDIVVGNRVQFTSARGGLTDRVFVHTDKHNMHSTNDATGLSLSGSFTTSKAEGGHSFNIKKAAVVSIADGKSSAGLSVTQGKGNNATDFSWMDINGDGLPDKVTKTGVSLNLGYRFAAEETWDHGAVQNGTSTNEGGGLGISLWNGSISAGISLARSDNEVTHSLQDVNGDGLVDLLIFRKGEPLQVRFNKGSSFAQAITWNGAYHIGKSSSSSESANVAFTAGIYIPIVNIKITINPSTSRGHGVSRELAKLNDMNGDGYPDFVESSKYDNMKVSYSTIGRTNMLKEVKRPLGASFAMDYQRIGNTYELPNSVWALSSVKVFDGFKGDGVDTLMTTFAYEGGFHNRHEREFYGFKKVITKTHDTGKKEKPVYTMVTQTFSNDNYYTKGMLLNELMQDGEGKKYVEKENLYKLKHIATGADLPDNIKEKDDAAVFVALVETKQKFYEGQPEPGKTTRMTYGYDTFGNVTAYTDFGDEGSEDDIHATIAYHNVQAKYILGSPKSIVVTGSGKTYRKRESTIDEETGNVKQIRQLLEDGTKAVHDLEYDAFGNLKKITRPANAKGQRLFFEYEYDKTVNIYTTKVSNSYGYSSEAVYDFSFGQVLKSTDLNGNDIIYELDDVGRVTKITGPYEKAKGQGYTIRFEYKHDAALPWARTKHFDPSNPKNDLETHIFVDGLGRVLQTKKDAAIYDGEGKPDKEMMVVSGRIVFDAFGRTTKAWYPVTEVLKEQVAFNPAFDTVDPTETMYDVLNRTLTVVLPDKALTKTEYGFDSDNKGKKQFSTKTTDANGKQTQQFTDVRGRVTAVKNITAEKDIWTSFVYNAINEQVEATDDLGHTTRSVYDMLGRRISRNHPDAGVTNYTYDLAGNLITLETANLAKAGDVIRYVYDHERLVEILYPQNPENNVRYTYGAPGASDNRVGRIVLQEDASGAQEFFYGPLGEVVKNVRTVIIPKHDEQTYVTEWTYDTWNRLTSMTYADGEQVEYTYNAGGLLRSMTGKKKSTNYTYVKQLGYDKFEQRVFLAYGNGTKTTYSYEPDRRRLKNMVAKTAAGRSMMDNLYEYDKVNNILSLTNKAPIPSNNLMGGASEYHYEYDDLYRLTEAKGSFKRSNEEHRYTLHMKYNSVGGILQKTQAHDRKTGGNWVEQKKTTYDQAYAYGETQPHAPIHIGKQAYTYDANGNQTGWTHDVSGQRRRILWDEENRMRAVYDNGAMYHYVYDASGERVLKGQSTGQTLFVNSENKGGSGNMGNFTVYVNPYLVLRSGGYTKHYYIEGQRIVSKLGGGWDNSGKGPLKAGGDKVDYNGKSQKVFDGIVKNLKFLGADGQILTAGKSGKIPPGQINGKGSTGGTGTVESFQYYYHPDHLGSTSYITDASGEVYQHLEYFAFGETFVEEHSNTDRTPYLFNGKELDEETGLYYYVQRYMDPKISIWLSVDQMAENMHEVSPYAYSMNNPVTLVDPDGKEPIKPYAGTVQDFIKIFNNTTSKMGQLKGSQAHDAMLRLGKVEMTFKGPKPATTAPFNMVKGRYIYTEKGGWIDMAHFTFYAGKAYGYKQEKEMATKMMNDPNFHKMPMEAQSYIMQKAGMSPVGEAVQDGYAQERFDPVYSAYSYEDLPSDKFGADFGANYFDPNSNLTFGEQLKNYLNNVLGATNPENAPNYKDLPEKESKSAPTHTNKTTKPMFVKEEEK